MGAAAAKNEYSLPESDVCYNTLEDFKNFTAVRINDFYRAFYYAQLGERIEQGIACCPELGDEALKYRPETTDWQALQKFELPSRILRNNDSCGKHLFNSETPTGTESLGNKWFKYRHALSQEMWQAGYSALTVKLRACCVKKLDHCLETATDTGTVQSCAERFSPEHQPRVALPGAPPTAPTQGVDSGSPGGRSRG